MTPQYRARPITYRRRARGRKGERETPAGHSGGGRVVRCPMADREAREIVCDLAASDPYEDLGEIIATHVCRYCGARGSWAGGGAIRCEHHADCVWDRARAWAARRNANAPATSR